MKTRIIFLTISIIMIILESILGYIVFSLSNDWITELILIGMMSVTLVIGIIIYNLYKDEIKYEQAIK